MQTRKQVTAALIAGTLALSACAADDATTDDTDLVTDTTVASIETTMPETDTTADPVDGTDTTTGDATDSETTIPGEGMLDLDQVDDQIESLSEQVEASGNEAVTEAWDELQSRYDETRQALEDGDMTDLPVDEVRSALEDMEATIEANADQLEPELEQAWNELATNLEQVIPGLTS